MSKTVLDLKKVKNTDDLIYRDGKYHVIRKDSKHSKSFYWAFYYDNNYILMSKSFKMISYHAQNFFSTRDTGLKIIPEETT